MNNSAIVVIVGVLSALYIINPGAGIFEFIPDNIPIIGNLDEATAVILLLASLRHFGIDFGNVFKNKKNN